ncbi:hypothetical protein BASA81_006125 [Batrachochytrium salamandrivorans]|nr:hypothetical protein BASA81_006125 [Batrachochytrium salamandrivorans]
MASKRMRLEAPRRSMVHWDEPAKCGQESPPALLRASLSPPEPVSANSSRAALSDDSIDFLDLSSSVVSVADAALEAKSVAELEAKPAADLLEDKLQPQCYLGDSHRFLLQLQFKFFTPSHAVVAKLPSTRQLGKWIVKAGYDLNVSSDSLFLCVGLMDRVFITKGALGADLQIFALACLMLATKFEEILPPALDSILDQHPAYTREKLLLAENQALNRLGFSLMTATPPVFLRRMQHLMSATEVKLSDYLCELTLLARVFLRFTPSLVAAAAVYCAVDWNAQQHGWPQSGWTREMETLAGYHADELQAVCAHLLQAFTQAHSSRPPTYYKFLAAEFYSVSTFCVDKLAPITLTPRAFQEGGR